MGRNRNTNKLKNSRLPRKSTTLGFTKNSLALAISAVVSMPYVPARAEIPIPCTGSFCNSNKTFESHGLPTGWRIDGQTGVGSVSIEEFEDRREMEVEQLSQSLLIEWDTFDIAPNNRVVFSQPDSDAVAVNRIFETSPSEIFGSLEANGQVLLFNRAGIIFGPESQVNVGTLVASSLELPDINGNNVVDTGDYRELVTSGLLSYFARTEEGSENQLAALINQRDLYPTDIADLSTTPNLEQALPDDLQAVEDQLNALPPVAERTQEEIALAETLQSQLDEYQFARNSGAYLQLPDQLPNVQGSDGGAFETGTVWVQQGAEIESRDFGRIMLFGSEVTNAGFISTPNGQAILAASEDQIWIEPVGSDFVVNLSGGGATTNWGEVVAEQGSIDLLGMAVNQNGVVRATTSINFSGDIELRAEEISSIREVGSQTNPAEAVLNDRGSVVFGEGSTTRVDLEIDRNSATADTAVAAQPHDSSRIDVVGVEVLFESDSKLLAPNGTIDVFANLANINDLLDESSSSRSFVEDVTVPRISVEDNVVFDVSGANTTLNAEDLVVEVTLTGTELADFPIQKDVETSGLRGQTLQFDIRDAERVLDENGVVQYLLPFANVTGPVQALEQRLEQRANSAGSINLNAGLGYLVLGNNITVDLSAGYTEYLPGFIETSQLIDEFGAIVSIGDADGSVGYQGILGTFQRESEKWATTQVWRTSWANTAIYDPGFIDYFGANAGEINLIGTSGIAGIDNLNIVTEEVASPLRRRSADFGATLRIGDAAGIPDPTQGNTLTIANTDGLLLGAPDIWITDDLDIVPVTNQRDEVVGDEIIGEEVGAIDLVEPIILSTDFIESNNISNLDLASNGEIRITDEAELTLQPNAELHLTAAAIEISGDIKIPSGSVTADLALVDQSIAVNSQKDDSNHLFLDNAVIDVSGVFTNDFNDDSALPDSDIAIHGGSIELNGSVPDAKLILQGESNLDVSGSAWINKAAELIGGVGGDISILMSELSSPIERPELLASENAALNVNGLGFRQGANINIRLPEVVIVDGNDKNLGVSLNTDTDVSLEQDLSGVETDENDSFDNLGSLEDAQEESQTLVERLGVEPANLVFESDFFKENGFSNFNITSTLSNVVIESGTEIQVQQKNYFVNSIEFISNETGDDVTPRIVTRNDFLRQPSNLDLTLSNDKEGENLGSFFLLEEGAEILLDPGARFSVNNDVAVSDVDSSGIFIDGKITSHSGEIILRTNEIANEIAAFNADNGLIWLGENAELDVSGTVIQNPDPLSAPSVRLLSGGEINLDSGGFLILNEGSLLDVSGVSSTITVLGDLPGESFAGASQDFSIGEIGSDAGSIYLSSAEGTLTQGEMRAFSGLETSRSGLLSFSIDGDRFVLNDDENTPFEENSRTQQIVLSDVDLAFDFENPMDPLNNESRDLADDLVSVDDEAPEGNDAGISELDPSEMDMPGERTLFSVAEANEFISGLGLLSVSSVERAGFGRLELNSSGTDRNNTRSLNLLVHDDSSVDELSLSLTESLIVNSNLINVSVNTSIDAPYIRVDGDSLTATEELTAGDNRVTFSSVFESSENRDAGLIDISRASISGVNELVFETSGDIRFTSNNGGINSLGTIILDSRQVYATTNSINALGFGGVNASITAAGFEFLNDDLDTETVPGRVIVVSNNRDETLPPLLSGVNSLSFNADDIFIDGVVRAPFGNIEINAAASATIGANALLSVSAENQIILYDEIRTGTTRAVAPENSGIDINGADIRVSEGALIDLSGGGDLLNWAFIPGPSGSRDVLDASVSPNSFAIIPEQDIAPLNDPNIITNVEIGRRVTLEDAVVLANGDTLEAGTYAVLPARYALLDNAWFVTLETDFTDLAPGSGVQLLDETPVVAGYFNTANTAVRDQRFSGFSIRPGYQSDDASVGVRDLSDYQFEFVSDRQVLATLASENSSIWRPENAASLQLSTQDRLVFEGLISGDGAGTELDGSGAQISISADNLRVSTERSNSNDGFVELVDSELNSLNVDSILLGGRRDITAEGESITAQSESLVISDGVNLVNDEILLTANRALDIGAANIRSETDLSGQIPISLVDTSSLVAVSNRRVSSLIRQGDQSSQNFEEPQIQVADTAQLFSENTLIFDSVADIQLLGADINGDLVRLGASKISLGDAPENEVGLVIPTDNLPDFLVANELVLRSTQNIDLFGDLEISGDSLSLTFDSSGLRNLGGGSTNINVGEINFTNSGNQTDASVSDQIAGSFSINADVMSIGENTFSLLGWDNLDANISNLILAGSNGGFDLKNTNTSNFTTGQISAVAGASNTIFANEVEFNSSGEEIEPDDTLLGLGSRLNVVASTIDFDVPLRFASGVISLEASSGDLVVGENAVLDVSGLSKEFHTLSSDTWGGRVSLVNEGGDVRVNPGASINLSGAGNEIAGELLVTAEIKRDIPIGSLVNAEGTVILPDGSSEELQQNLRDISVGTSIDIPAGSFQLGESYYELSDGSIAILESDDIIPDDAVSIDPSTLFVNGRFIIPEQIFRLVDGSEVYQLDGGDYVQVLNGERIILADFEVPEDSIGVIPEKVFIPSAEVDSGEGSLIFADGRQEFVDAFEVAATSTEITEDASYLVQVASGTVLFDNGEASLLVHGNEQAANLARIHDANGAQTSLIRQGESTPGGTELDEAARIFNQNKDSAIISLEGGSTVFAGELIGATDENARGASIYVDTARILSESGDENFNGFNTQLNNAGFNETRQFRIRQGDIRLNEDTSIIAKDVRLALDQGNLDIAGLVDASGIAGGKIELAASGDLVLQNSAQLLATGNEGEGGDISLTSYQSFQYDELGLPIISGLIVHEDASLDVSGEAGGGQIRYQALRNEADADLNINGNDDLNLWVIDRNGESTQFSNQNVGADSIVAEGVRQYHVEGTKIGNFIGTLTRVVDESQGEYQVNEDGQFFGFLDGRTTNESIVIEPLDVDGIALCEAGSIECSEFFTQNEETGQLESLGVFQVNRTDEFGIREDEPFVDIDGQRYAANPIGSREGRNCGRTISCTEFFFRIEQNFSGEISRYTAITSETSDFIAVPDGEIETAASKRLGILELGNAELASGLEVLADGDFSFEAIIDGDEYVNDLRDIVAIDGAGTVSVLASGDLFIDQRLGLTISDSDSWNINFSSGADSLSSAAWVLNNNVTRLDLAESSRIVSGSGDISLYSSGDIHVQGQILSLGRESGLGSIKITTTESQPLTERGGDIALFADGNIYGNTDTDLSFFEARQDALPVPQGVRYIVGQDDNVPSGPTGVDLIFVDAEESNSNIESIAGGDVSIYSGGDLDGLVARLFTPILVDSNNEDSILRVTESFGSGNLSVSVGGNVNQNFLSVGNGNGSLITEGRIGSIVNAEDDKPNLPVFGLQAGYWTLRSSQEASIDGVVNQTLPFALTYGDSSALEIKTLSGDINLFAEALNLGTLNRWLPGTLESVAFSGDINTFGDLFLSPSSFGSFNLLADQNINIGMITENGTELSSSIFMSETNPQDIPITPDGSINLSVFNILAGSDSSLVLPPLNLLHEDSLTSSSIVALNGNYDGSAGPISVINLSLPTELLVFAGNDIIEPKVNIKHASADSISTFLAEGKISDVTINVAGPGRLDLIAGEGIDFSSTAEGPQPRGVSSRGSLASAPGSTDGDLRLAGEGGADINVYVGVLPDTLNWQAFIQPYLNTQENLDVFAIDLRAFVDEVSRDIQGVELEAVTELTDYEVLQRFLEFPQDVQADFASTTFSGDDGLDQIVKGFAYSLEITSQISSSNNANLFADVFLDPESSQAELRELLLIDSIRLFRDPNFYLDYYQTLGIDEPDSLTIAAIQERLNATGFDVDERQSQLNFFNQFSTTSRRDIIERSFLLLDEAEQREITFDAYNQLAFEQQQELILDVFFGQLRDAGRLSNQIGTPGYLDGYEAIAELFPNTSFEFIGENTQGQDVYLFDSQFSGDLTMELRRIYTLDGGDINIVVPGGLVNAGDPSVESPENPQETGIVAAQAGDIRTYTAGDFLVNQSRVQTLGGGSILMWSSAGDLDAGRGARTALSVPAPVQILDPNTGAISLDFGASIVGSGIRQSEIASTQEEFIVDVNGVKPNPGIDLIAPNGAVDAGEAGIFAEGNLSIAANEVVNAEFIEAGGETQGVPTDPGSIAADLAGASDLGAAAGAAAEDAAGDDLVQDNPLSWIEVSILGFGDVEEESSGSGAKNEDEPKSVDSLESDDNENLEDATECNSENDQCQDDTNLGEKTDQTKSDELALLN